jgi:plasmid stabilization system protein ParE
LKVSAEALADIARHRRYWFSIRVELGESWSRSLHDALTRIENAPLRFAERAASGARRFAFRLGAQQYLIDYIVDETEIVVLRVWHGRQNRPK